MQVILSWWLVITLACCGAWDVYAILFMPANSTVSYEIYSLGKRMPTLYLFIGGLLGHIIVPLHVTDPAAITPPGDVK